MNGKIILLLGTSIIVFYSCFQGNQVVSDKVYLWQGERDSSYFELIVKKENDTIYSYINDWYSGSMPVMKNALPKFRSSNSLNMVHNDILFFSTLNETGELNVLGEKIPIRLDTTFELDSRYLESISYDVDFHLRMAKFYGYEMDSINVNIQWGGGTDWKYK